MINSYKNIPKISCLLIAGPHRLEYLKRSIQCYLDQNYPNLELIILNDSGLEYRDQILNHTKSLQRNDIRCFFLEHTYTLGALRNLSLALMDGEIFVQWDDDDFSHPWRIVKQYEFLVNCEKPVCFLSDQFHYFFDTKELFWEDWHCYLSGGQIRSTVIPGTVMGYRNGLQARYASSGSKAARGEDTVFSDILCNARQAAFLSGNGHLQVYGYHGKNVWDVGHHRLLSKFRSHYRTYMLEKRDVITDSLNYFKFDGPVRVMGRDGLAFIYDHRSTP